MKHDYERVYVDKAKTVPTRIQFCKKCGVFVSDSLLHENRDNCIGQKMIMSKLHELKTIQPFFDDIWYSVKEFEVRKNDRNFKIDDLVQLNEYVEGKCTGKTILISITYILDNPEYCKEGFIVFGFRIVDKVSKQEITNENYRGSWWQRIKCRLGFHSFNTVLPCPVCYFCEAYDYKNNDER